MTRGRAAPLRRSVASVRQGSTYTPITHTYTASLNAVTASSQVQWRCIGRCSRERTWVEPPCGAGATHAARVAGIID